MPEAVQRVDWPRERLESYQLDLLRQLLAHAKRHSRWYAERRLSGIDPATATEAEVWFTQDDVAAGRDTVIEAALAWIAEENGAIRRPPGPGTATGTGSSKSASW
jgi:hypothetical protein